MHNTYKHPLHDNTNVCSVALHSLRHSNRISGLQGHLLPGKYTLQDGMLIDRSSGNERVRSAVNVTSVVSLADIGRGKIEVLYEGFIILLIMDWLGKFIDFHVYFCPFNY